MDDYLERERPFTPDLVAADVPADAVTTSASGVDPHISFDNARIQANRVAAERDMPLDDVLALVDDATSRPLFGLGRPEVRQRREAQRCAGGAAMTDRPERSLFERDIMRAAIAASFAKLDPRLMARNPVMFVVEIGAVLTTLIWIVQAFGGEPGRRRRPRLVHVHGRDLAVADRALRQLRRGDRRGPRQGAGRRAARDAHADRRAAAATARTKPANELARGDVVVVEAGEVIPGDGTVIEGIASVDESAITGESAPVIRESGGDRSAVTGGTRVLSDHIVVEITQEPGQSFLDRMIALVEGAARRKTPNEIALSILLAGLTIVFLAVVVTLRPFAEFAGTDISITILIALLVALIPTTIGALLSAIGIAGMDRLVRRNVLALSGRAVEASGDVDVLLLDKTGTITLGNRQAAAFVPMPGVEEAELAEAAQYASLADETPEGRSIVVLAKQYGCASTSSRHSTRGSSRSPRRRA